MYSPLLLLALASTPPAPLACLDAWYAVTPGQQADGRWTAVLGDGVEVPWDDGREKTFDEKLEAPDLEDMFSIPYRPGPIQPVTARDEDPGRIRVDALFQATYGHSEQQVRKALVPVEILGQRLLVHSKAGPAFERVGARLADLVKRDPTLRPFLQRLGGTFLWRPIANTRRQSAHSYGVSIDINVKRAHYWEWQKPKEPLRWQNAIPREIVAAFEAEGFIWGGRWYHYDTMHFEYRPELLEPRCRS